MAVCTLLVLLVLLYNTGDSLGAEVRSSIIGGKDAPKGRWPWMVLLNMTSDDRLNQWICGATIINPEWLLTAASCLKGHTGNTSWDHAFFWIGAYQLGHAPACYRGVETVIRHHEFETLDNKGYSNDIALVKLNKPIKGSCYQQVKPVKLPNPTETFGPSDECWITGWGDIDNNVPLSDEGILQELKINILPLEKCRATSSYLNDTMLCAGEPDGGKDACKGDYGGPLMCRSGRDYVQVGIMSFGAERGCGVKGHPSVYTRVSRYLDFIDDYVNNTSELKSEAPWG